MTDEATSAAPKLPPGDADPNLVYIAVGKAIHRWEGLEDALARLALKLAGIPDEPHNYPMIGKRNGMLRQRLAALEATAAYYFSLHPGQELEGEFASLIEDVTYLAIERHRIAHGHITMWGEIQLPEKMVKGEAFTMEMTPLYRWAPPWYGIEKLKTNPVGLNGAGIDEVSQQFEILHNRVHAFTEKIPQLRPSREK